jgi:hypothetical protein
MLVENKMGLPIARSTRRGGVTVICDEKGCCCKFNNIEA